MKSLSGPQPWKNQFQEDFACTFLAGNGKSLFNVSMRAAVPGFYLLARAGL